MKAERYRDLDLLHPDILPMAYKFLALCVEARIMIVIVETWRSTEAHEEDVKNGSSWVKKSKHQNTITKKIDLSMEVLEAPLSQLTVYPAALAIDVAPYDQYQLHGPNKLQWDGNDPVWLRLGKIGESVGLKWGGRWETVPPDMAHFQAPFKHHGYEKK